MAGTMVTVLQSLKRNKRGEFSPVKNAGMKTQLVKMKIQSLQVGLLYKWVSQKINEECMKKKR